MRLSFCLSLTISLTLASALAAKERHRPRNKPADITFDVRILRIPGAYDREPFNRFKKLPFLSESQLILLLEDVQGERLADVILFDSLSARNGKPTSAEHGNIRRVRTDAHHNGTQKDSPSEFFEQFIGTRISVKGTLSQDRQAVLLTLKSEVTELTETAPSSIAMSGPRQETAGDRSTKESPIKKEAIEVTRSIPLNKNFLKEIGSAHFTYKVRSTPPLLEDVPLLNKIATKVETRKELHKVYALISPCIPGDPRQSGAKSLTVADVAAMASGGVSNEIILNQISTTRTRFVLSADDFVFLKRRQVPDAVVRAMQMTQIDSHSESQHAP